MATNGDTLSKDEVFDVLSSARRRFVLQYLFEEGPTATLPELTQRLASWEYETDVEDLTEQEEKRVYVSLYQTHIPKMSDMGIIEYDTEENLITLQEPAELFRPFLDVEDVDEEEESTALPWHSVYLVLALLGLGWFAAVWLGLPVIGQFSYMVVAVVVVGVLTVLALAQYAQEGLGGRTPVV